jgi:hypothetical protein
MLRYEKMQFLFVQDTESGGGVKLVTSGVVVAIKHGKKIVRNTIAMLKVNKNQYFYTQISIKSHNSLHFDFFQFSKFFTMMLMV